MIKKWIASLLAVALLFGCATQALPVADGIGSGVGSVAILVVDEFDPVAPRVTGTATQNCLYTGQQTNVVGSTGAGDNMPVGLPHGSVVFDRVRAELNSTPYLAHIATPPPPVVHPRVVPSYLDSWQYRSSRVLLVGIDSGGYDTTTVTTHLNAVMQVLRTQHGIDRFVVNMSFVIAPCNVREWLEKNGAPMSAGAVLTLYYSFIEDFAALRDLKPAVDSILATTPPDRLLATLLGDPRLAPLADRVPVNMFYALFSGLAIGDIDPLANTPVGRAFRQVNSDPIRRYLTEQTIGPMIPVAAAGNGAFTVRGNVVRHTPLAFPFAPGLWNNVVSVSAFASASVTPASLASYSNSGEVMLDGETPQGVHGTSFAAPRLSAREAIYLLAGGPIPCEAEIPPLGYVDFERSWKADTIDGPLWLNLSVADAAARSCRDFVAWSTLNGSP